MNPSQTLREVTQPASAGLLSHSIVNFYRFWHGRCGLPGARLLLKKSSQFLGGLQHYPLKIAGIGTVPVDFRDYSGLLWLQHLMGDRLASTDIEGGLFAAIGRFLKDGDVFWDVGANVGTVSVHVVNNFPNARVFAFEPNPHIFNSLNTLFKGHPRVKPFACALSDHSAQVTMTIPKGKSVGGSIEGLDYVLKSSNRTREEMDQVSVEAISADELLARDSALLPPKVIKIDVEGHESAVLRGMAQTIAKHRPVLFFEHLYLSDAEVAGLVPSGYAIHSVNNESGGLSPGFERNAGHNSVLVPKAAG